MFETLVSSRIRRALFEFVLTHPQDRFYLRGLAKDLGVSVSPLRRELKKLEKAGMLRTAQEANVLFYTVITESPQFQQLVQASSQSAPQPAPSARVAVPAMAAAAAGLVPQPALAQPTEAAPSFWTRPLRASAMIGVVSVSMTFILGMVGLFYHTMTNQPLGSTLMQRNAIEPPAPAQVEFAVSASGLMKGNRWQLQPGGFGGFSSGASKEGF